MAGDDQEKVRDDYRHDYGWLAESSARYDQQSSGAHTPACGLHAGPGADATARNRLRAALPALIERHGSWDGDRVALTSAYVMVVAIRP